jgi:O-antigen/teichoic acid export membrane protein
LTVRPLFTIIIILALGLVFFYTFSAPYGDGLEVTMDEGGAGEGESAFNAPLDYGDDYATTFAMGLVGFAVIVILFMAVGRAFPDKDSRDETGSR